MFLVEWGPPKRTQKDYWKNTKATSLFFKQGAESLISLVEKMRGTEVDDWERDKFLNLDLEAMIALCLTPRGHPGSQFLRVVLPHE